MEKTEKELIEETVCISVKNLVHLLRSDEQLEILRTAYESMDMYAVEHVMDAVFGVANKYKADE